ncbi:MAG: tetratricopeptide repeat protein [Solirubrobacterales bacterium]
MSCTQPGCAGELVDGYCNLCGMSPRSPSPAASQAQPPAAGAAPAGSSTMQASGSATAVSRRSGTARTGAAERRRLGAGLVEVPSVPYRDPASVLLSEPNVAESRRFCAGCRDPVGRGQDGSPGRAEGFCRNCGTPFSFIPKLAAGDLVASQYEVAGCLAHGGLGWIYLAKDRNVSDRWVVLKGLLDSNDEDAMAAALAERRFLAEVEHPNIVKIFNFVEHHGSGYIVMEYVGGTSLKDVLAGRREANGDEPDPLPVTQAIAYMLEILPALGHLHGEGLLFCDFKPENVIQTRHSLKLIDLGGIYRIDDESSPVYGTVGYQAPEIAESGPSIPSDLFTVARTLAVLCIDFKSYQSTFKYTLPPQETVALFIEHAEHDSLYRLLAKATAPNPDDRFQSAQEMVDQLYGVLREIVAAERGRPAPAPSTLFTSDFRAKPDSSDWRLLPSPLLATEDPAAGYLATLAATDPQELTALLRGAPQRTVEVDLRLAHALIDAGELQQAEELLAAIVADDPWEWRVAWHRGTAELAREQPVAARAHFEIVYAAVPGELAPKLALGVCAELAHQPADAADWYEVVSRTDPGYTTATFGLARCRLACGERAGALAAYERVPESSSSYIEAQTARIRCLIERNGTHDPEIAALQAAGACIEALSLGATQRASLTADLLLSALTLLEGEKIDEDPDVQLAGHPLTDHDVRLGLERTYRSLARVADSPDERIRLVDWANRVRPRTWT